MSAGLLLIPVALYFVPIDWLKNQDSICLFKCITGRECYGCGITKAVISAIQLDLSDAYHFNKLFIIVLPLLAYIWAKSIIRIWTNKIPGGIFNSIFNF